MFQNTMLAGGVTFYVCEGHLKRPVLRQQTQHTAAARPSVGP